MSEITIIGGGEQVRVCREALQRAGYRPRHSFELDEADSSPLVLGELQNGFQIARQAVLAGRHLLIADSLMLMPERLSLLLEERRPSQALFVWHQQRYQPGFRFLHSLAESDGDCRPRYLRHESLTIEPSSNASFRRRTLEALALLSSTAESAAETACATAVVDSSRNAPDLLSARLTFKGLEAMVSVGMGEGIERHETLVVSPSGRLLVDGLSDTTVHAVDAASAYGPAGRRLSHLDPSLREAAGEQCLAFLEATHQPRLARREAATWQQALAALQAIDRSLAAGGAVMPVLLKSTQPRFRLIPSLRPTAPSAA